MRKVATALALVLIASCCAQAQDQYPSKSIKLVLPQPAGGAVDLIARSLGDRLSEQMRQPVAARISAQGDARRVSDAGGWCC